MSYDVIGGKQTNLKTSKLKNKNMRSLGLIWQIYWSLTKVCAKCAINKNGIISPSDTSLVYVIYNIPLVTYIDKWPFFFS